MTTSNTPSRPASRVFAKDEDGNRYVETQLIDEATVTVTGFTKEEREDGKIRWTSATYSVTGPDGKPGAELHWNGSSFTVGDTRCKTFREAVKASLAAAPAPRKRTSRKPAAEPAKITETPAPHKRTARKATK
jgi:hypothetical protein